MKIDVCKIVFDELNDRADRYKEQCFCMEKFHNDLKLLFDSVDQCNLCNSDKFCVQNLIINREIDLETEIRTLKLKIESIDEFVAVISQSINDNEETCIYCDLESDNKCVNTL